MAFSSQYQDDSRYSGSGELSEASPHQLLSSLQSLQQQLQFLEGQFGGVFGNNQAQISSNEAYNDVQEVTSDKKAMEWSSPQSHQWQQWNEQAGEEVEGEEAYGTSTSREVSYQYQVHEPEDDDNEAEEELQQLQEKLQHLLRLRDYLVSGAQEEIRENAGAYEDEMAYLSNNTDTQRWVQDSDQQQGDVQYGEEGRSGDLRRIGATEAQNSNAIGDTQNVASGNAPEEFDFLWQLRERMFGNEATSGNQNEKEGDVRTEQSDQEAAARDSEDVEKLTQVLNDKWSELVQMRDNLESLERERKQLEEQGQNEHSALTASQESYGTLEKDNEDAATELQQQSKQLQTLLETLEQLRSQKSELENLMETVNESPDLVEEGIDERNGPQATAQPQLEGRDSGARTAAEEQSRKLIEGAMEQASSESYGQESLQDSMNQLRSLLEERNRLQQQLSQLREEASEKEETLIIENGQNGEVDTEEVEYSDDFESVSSLGESRPAQHEAESGGNSNVTDQISSSNQLSSIMEQLRSQFMREQSPRHDETINSYESHSGEDQRPNFAHQDKSSLSKEPQAHQTRHGSLDSSERNESGHNYLASPATKDLDSSAEISFAISPDVERTGDGDDESVESQQSSHSSNFEVNLSPNHNLNADFDNEAFAAGKTHSRPPPMPRANPMDWLKVQRSESRAPPDDSSESSSALSVESENSAVQTRILRLVESLLQKANTSSEGNGRHQPVVGGLLLEVLRDLRKLPSNLLQQPEFAKSVAMQTKSAIRHTAKQLKSTASDKRSEGVRRSTGSTADESVSTVDLEDSHEVRSSRKRSKHPGVARIPAPKHRSSDSSRSSDIESNSDTSADDHHARVYPLPQSVTGSQDVPVSALSSVLRSVDTLNERLTEMKILPGENGKEYENEPFDYAESVETSHAPPSSPQASGSTRNESDDDTLSYNYLQSEALQWRDNVWDDDDGQNNSETSSSVDSSIIPDNDTSGYTGFRRASCNYAESVKSHEDSEVLSEGLESKNDEEIGGYSSSQQGFETKFEEIQGYLNRLRGVWNIQSPSKLEDGAAAPTNPSDAYSEDASWSFTSDWNSTGARAGSFPSTLDGEKTVPTEQRDTALPVMLKEGDVSSWEARSDSDDRASIENLIKSRGGADRKKRFQAVKRQRGTSSYAARRVDGASERYHPHKSGIPHRPARVPRRRRPPGSYDSTNYTDNVPKGNTIAELRELWNSSRVPPRVDEGRAYKDENGARSLRDHQQHLNSLLDRLDSFEDEFSVLFRES
eukprot:gb/GECG01015317.1/.p1 GENE.gb/GECG01015317.1/~~gb/GECG01015317.1/.p1  ORF type:complete len:1274 (+),score=264.31 gb/GECG01015317.1/:1-3822(+)